VDVGRGTLNVTQYSWYSLLRSVLIYVHVAMCCVVQMEANASFLRAARAGALDKVLECLDHNGADIDACNPVCVCSTVL